MIARSTASRSSSLPCVRSTTSRMPARIAAGSRPFHDLSRTATIAIIGAVRPDELGQAERVGILHLGRQHEDVDRVVRLDEDLLGRRHRLHEADVLRLDLERPGQGRPERLRRADGDDRLQHGYFVFSGRNSCATVSGARSTPASSGGSSDMYTRPFSSAKTNCCASSGRNASVSSDVAAGRGRHGPVLVHRLRTRGAPRPPGPARRSCRTRGRSPRPAARAARGRSPSSGSSCRAGAG